MNNNDNVKKQEKSKMLEIKYKKTGESFKINIMWLRDHCRCINCFDMNINERIYNFLDIPLNIKPLSTNYTKNEQYFDVEWSDGHYSSYNIEILYNAQYVKYLQQRKQQTSLRLEWHEKSIRTTEQNLHVNISDLLSTGESVKKLVTSLIRYGIGFIDGVPADGIMTEFAIRRVFPIMRTFFADGIYYINSTVQLHEDSAYTNKYLNAHTDHTHFCDPAGLLALHCIEHINVVGGENFFIDGLHAANELKRCNPAAYKMLTETQIPAIYIEKGQYHKFSAPIIQVDAITGEIVHIRYNPFDRAIFNSLPQELMPDFYDAYRAFTRIVQLPENQWKVKLTPGTVVIFDNWRLMHGRHAYNGARTLAGCYVQRTDFMSKARVLGIID